MSDVPSVEVFFIDVMHVSFVDHDAVRVGCFDKPSLRKPLKRCKGTHDEEYEVSSQHIRGK